MAGAKAVVPSYVNIGNEIKARLVGVPDSSQSIQRCKARNPKLPAARQGSPVSSSKPNTASTRNRGY